MASGDDTRVPASTTCAIVGGGPAGLVLGLLLARAGIRVTVLEKHADFLRDFRGDTVHPSTLSLLDDLGLFERFNALQQSHLTRVSVPGADGGQVVLADFGRLPLRHPYIAMVPQWDLLNLLADAAGTEPGFTLLKEHAVTRIVRDGNRVAGVDYDSPELLPDLAAGLTGLLSMDDVKHLDVRVDRLRRWYAPGVLCIGDAAHAMSPVGGVGINLAVQDAVAAARLLAQPLREGRLGRRHGTRYLARVQHRRMIPAAVLQRLQRAIHTLVIMRVLRGEVTTPPPLLGRVLERVPALTAIPAFLIGVGPRPERAPGWARRSA
ncbi:NAD(P)-binding protein [Arthrobacter sp. 260]|nr:FAD-dependent monooxygenase [Arthrobacter sp. 260]NOJ59458.1 NAD(P)-binding protein [Arthrobacter sp. 260]